MTAQTFRSFGAAAHEDEGRPGIGDGIGPIAQGHIISLSSFSTMCQTPRSVRLARSVRKSSGPKSSVPARIRTRMMGDGFPDRSAELEQNRSRRRRAHHAPPRGTAHLSDADRDAPRSSPPSIVLHMGERDRSVRTGQRIITGWIALEAEVVEAALLAVHVQLLREVGALAPRTAPLALTGPDVPTATGTLLELHPGPHDGAFSHRLTPLTTSLLLLGWSTTAGRHMNTRRIGSKRVPIIGSETMVGRTVNGTVCDEAVGRPSVREAR